MPRFIQRLDPQDEFISFPRFQRSSNVASDTKFDAIMTQEGQLFGGQNLIARSIEVSNKALISPFLDITQESLLIRGPAMEINIREETTSDQLMRQQEGHPPSRTIDPRLAIVNARAK